MTASQTEIIKKALLDIELAEVKYIDNLSDVSFEFSDGYKAEINKLIIFERKRESSLLRLSARKRLTVLVASILLLFLTLTACIFKDHIKEFVIEYYGTMTRFLSPYDETGTDYQEYTFSYIPKGYSLTETFEFQNWAKYEYSDSKHILYLTQSSLSGSSIQIDTENSSYDVLQINGINVYRSEKNSTVSVVWKTDTTAFSLICHTSIGWTEIENIILGAIPKK